MLVLPHIAPLAAYVRRLREQSGFEVPDFDPLDGGTDARILFLFEKPGPMTATSGSGRRVGSGFISRNNDDPSAAATHAFAAQAGLPRRDTVSWNLIPWWNGSMTVTSKECAEGLAELRNLLPLLPHLKAAVMVGRTAARARPVLSGLRLFESAHTSMRVRNAFPQKWSEIPEI